MSFPPLHRPRPARGAAAIEFALVAPLLLALVFGIISYGFMLTLRQSISQAAAEGARAAAVTLRSDARVEAAQDAVDDAMSPHGVTCDDNAKLVRDGVVVGTCAVAPPTRCEPAGTTTCITVTLTYAYRDHPLVPSVPGLGLVLPQRLSYAATSRVS